MKKPNNKSWEEFYRLIQPSDLLFPENEYKVRVIPEGLFKHLQARARKLLEDRPAASTYERQHWQQIVDGMAPYGMIIERKTPKGVLHVSSISQVVGGTKPGSSVPDRRPGQVNADQGTVHHDNQGARTENTGSNTDDGSHVPAGACVVRDGDNGGQQSVPGADNSAPGGELHESEPAVSGS